MLIYLHLLFPPTYHILHKTIQISAPQTINVVEEVHM